MTTPFRLRGATLDDVDALVATTSEGFAGYPAFAPAGWTPPAGEAQAQGLRARLERPETWCALAESADEIVGHVVFLPAGSARKPVDDPELAHLQQLFVRPAFWGSGVATHLLRAATEEAASRRFGRIRLFTPTGQRRARRFYEREGWRARGAAFLDEPFGLSLVEYHRTLAR